LVIQLYIISQVTRGYRVEPKVFPEQEVVAGSFTNIISK
jgi:hypothetical protein